MSEKTRNKNGKAGLLRKWSDRIFKKRTRKTNKDLEECSSNISINSSMASDGGRHLSTPGNNVSSPNVHRKHANHSASKGIDNLYVSVLTAICHPILPTMDKKTLLLYIQDVFEMSDEYHERMLRTAEKKKSILFMSVRYSAEQELSHNLNLRLMLLDNVNMETEIFLEKPTGIKFIPIRKENFDMVELELWHNGNNTDNILLGKTIISLKDTTISDFDFKFNLTNNKSISHENILNIRISFSYRKITKILFQHHQRLVKKFLESELDWSKTYPYWWFGKFSAEAAYILTQYASQNGLSQTAVALTSFLSYLEVHNAYPISFEVFADLLSILVTSCHSQEMDDSDLDCFYEALKTLVSLCFNFIGRIRNSDLDCNVMTKQVREVLRCLSLVNHLVVRKDQKNFLGENEICDIREMAKDIVAREISRWLAVKTDFRREKITDNIIKLRCLIELTKSLEEDLQLSLKRYNDSFKKYLQFDHTKYLYEYYEDKLTGFFEFEVKSIIRNLPKIHYVIKNIQEIPNVDGFSDDDDSLSGGKYLFCLFSNLRFLVDFGRRLYLNEYNFYLANFYQWFHDAVRKWLDMQSLTAGMLIRKAITKDTFNVQNSTISSSATQTVLIFYQIKKSWEKLNWPDTEDSCKFILKIVTDIICKCCIYYTDIVTNKANEMLQTNEGIDLVKLCVAINNVEHLLSVIESFVNRELGVTKLLKHLENSKNENPAFYEYEKKYVEVIQSTTTSIEDKMGYMLKLCAIQMEHTINELFREMISTTTPDCIDIMLMYIEDNLNILKRLGKNNFEIVAIHIWSNIVRIFKETTRKYLMEQMMLENLKLALKDMKTIFLRYGIALNNNVIEYRGVSM